MANVADAFRDGRDVSWLETELARQLCPVAAPDSLWRRIHEQRRPLRVRPNPWRVGSIAAAAGLLLLAGMVWRLGAMRETSNGLEALAERELRGMESGTGRVDFRSGDPREIREWVRAKLGVDVRLDRAASGDRATQLVSARIVPFGKYSVAVIAYRVDGDYAAMLVSGSHTGVVTGAGHAGLRVRSDGEVLAYSWTRGSNDYAIAFGAASDSRRPCLLCHASPPALMAFR